MRIGIYGGTFDPVHLGHLILAEQCRDQAQLDQVWFVPAARPPQKLGAQITPFAQRVEMLALALAGNPAFQISEVEKDRPGPSYTADTVRQLHAEHPAHELYLLMGSDSLVDVPKWYEPVQLVELARFVVMTRPGHGALDVDAVRAALSLPAGVELRVHLVDAPLIDISGRYLRERAGQGRSIRYLVPRAVEVYVQEKGLYQ